MSLTTYFTGSFTNISGVSAARIAKWSNGTWSALGTGLSDMGLFLTANGNSIFVGGGFTEAGGIEVPTGGARWQLSADVPLHFTYGVVDGNDVYCDLAGIPEVRLDVQRLDFPSDSWVTQETLTLDASGVASFASSVTNHLGYFRAISIDHAYPSTNAFGSIVDTVAPGYWLIGNPFQSLTCSEIIPNPTGGVQMGQMTAGSLTTSTYDDLDEVWSSEKTFVGGEGALVNNPGVNPLGFQVYGIFFTNSFSRILPTNYSILASPLYHKLPGGTATQIDMLTNSIIGGLSRIPTNSAANPKAYANRNKAGVASQYINYTLTTGDQWQTNSVNTFVPILIGEGVFFENRSGTNQTWTVPLTIW